MTEKGAFPLFFYWLTVCGRFVFVSLIPANGLAESLLRFSDSPYISYLTVM